MTAATAQLVKEQDDELAQRVHSRAGVITPKGKAPMQTFWLFTDDDMIQVQTRFTRLLKRNSEGALLETLPEMAQPKHRFRPRSRSLDGAGDYPGQSVMPQIDERRSGSFDKRRSFDMV